MSGGFSRLIAPRHLSVLLVLALLSGCSLFSHPEPLPPELPAPSLNVTNEPPPVASQPAASAPQVAENVRAEAGGEKNPALFFQAAANRACSAGPAASAASTGGGAAHYDPGPGTRQGPGFARQQGATARRQNHRPRGRYAGRRAGQGAADGRQPERLHGRRRTARWISPGAVFASLPRSRKLRSR